MGRQALKDVELARGTAQSFERDLATTLGQLTHLKQQLEAANATNAGHQEAISTITALQGQVREEQVRQLQHDGWTITLRAVCHALDYWMLINARVIRWYDQSTSSG